MMLDSALLTVELLCPVVFTILVLSLLWRAPASASQPREYTSLPTISDYSGVAVGQDKNYRGPAIASISTIVLITYIVDGCRVALATLTERQRGQTPSIAWTSLVDVLGILAFGGFLVLGSRKGVRESEKLQVFVLLALVCAVGEVTIIGIMLFISTDPVLRPRSLDSILQFGLAIVRLLAIGSLLLLLFNFPPSSVIESSATLSEHSNLLTTSTAEYNAIPSEATVEGTSSRDAVGPKDGGAVNVQKQPGWGKTLLSLRRLVPYLWPRRSRPLQFMALLSMLLLLLGRVINVLSPLTLKALVDVLEMGTGGRLPLKLILAFVGVRLIQGSGGLVNIRNLLWIPVLQYSEREMAQLGFDHLLNLSLAFHTRRNTGEVMQMLNNGAAINNLFQVMINMVIPPILDGIIGVGTFLYFFGWELCLAMFSIMAVYVYASVRFTNWGNELRRSFMELSVVTRGICSDSILNYDTVKYFVGEKHESARYQEALLRYQAVQFKFLVGMDFLRFGEGLTMSLGLLLGSLIVVWRIVNSSNMSASDFIFFISYLDQLYQPLNTLGLLYGVITQQIVDTEKLLTLLNEPTEIVDRPGAPDLVVMDGVITFENVSFSYDDKREALRGVSFTVQKGQSIALVGESGGGKSTILKLLFRSYDLQPGQGRILIDGQDIRDVTQSSLRRAIGVVPQETALFNATLAYNIGYGKFGSTQAEIEAAARAAQMHDRILGFPDRYETKVGELGVRLSGGEKQRVSIARTFLKNAPILALDEATSSLDTSTEKDIQKALQTLLHGKTSISIAHRLSTIASADCILVLKEGRIVESGSHEALLAQHGQFAAMWAKQITKDSDTPTSDSKGQSVSELTAEGVIEGQSG
ncbi:hypothetical protein FRB94_005732 [Tulasnella sp. JGI-2019a]|nr:hypothetical protein FRB94_005732 [Tulasnella sp. JGI-2019a]KAG9000927.1 hypothetical protein FRB93_012532 [Tulasnella sp. JGI-2019a]